MPGVSRRLYHKRIGAGKALDPFGYGIISLVNSLDDLLQSYPVSIHRVLSAIVYAQERYGLLAAGLGPPYSPAPIVVGLSGGADSVCLLHALSLLAPHWNLTLHAAHVDHGLRAASAADADFAEDIAEEMGIQFHILRLDASALTADERGVEAAARAKRYAFFAEVARKVVADERTARSDRVQLIPTVAVAHHQDDQAETVLMNFVRGSGLRGLRGMAWIRTMEDVTEIHRGDYAQPGANQTKPVRLVRPLLGLRRHHLLEYNQALGLSHCEDATNRDTAYMRNRVRHIVLPALAELNPQIIETLARTAELLRPEAERAEALDAEALQSVTVDDAAPERVVLDLAQYRLLPTAAQHGSMRLLCEKMGIDARDAGFRAINEIQARTENNPGAGGPYSLAGNLQWSVVADEGGSRALLSVHRPDILPLRPIHPHLAELLPGVSLPVALHPGNHAVVRGWSLRCELRAPEALPPAWRAEGNQWRAFLDADRVRAPVLATPTPGLKFTPLGMSGQRKSLGDFFTDRKTTAPLRTRWPIVMDAANASVLWVCGHTISHNVRITDATRRVLCLAWVRNPDADTAATFTNDVAARSYEEAACGQM